ncbi:MAG: hypothetical protein IPO81_31475 [Kouleothrix sp.]|nr:hypothetical protein [Kouleothrix sp.]
MHKATYLEGRVELTIEPDGPILIKAGESGGGEPTRPDMEFVRTRFRGAPAAPPDDSRARQADQIYLPGPSLKGVVRAQAERIARTLDSDALQQESLARRQELDRREWQALVRREQARARAEGRPEPAEQDLRSKQARPDAKLPLADNPLADAYQRAAEDEKQKEDDRFHEEAQYRGIEDMRYSSGRYVESIRGSLRDYPERTAIIYRRSSLVSQIFGHTGLAGRVRFADAYGQGVVTEERNGVAIDRIYGSVAVGPFNYEAVIAGRFPTSVDFKNVTLAQLALLGLALRDLAEGRIALGFGKSRGMGRVRATFGSLELRYPACEPSGGWLRLLGGRKIVEIGRLAGVGAFEPQSPYDFPEDDQVDLPAGLAYRPDEERGMGTLLRAEGHEAVRSIWRACMPAWKRAIGWAP